MKNEKQPAVRKARVVLVDDHPVIRRGLSALIRLEADLDVCGEAGDAREALELIGRENPAVAVVDISLSGPDGIELIKDIKIRYPEVKVLVLSMHDESVYAERALRAGARGYLMKSEPLEHVMGAIRRVLKGEIHVSERFAARLLHQVVGHGHTAETSAIDRLSDRELQVFRSIGQGMGIRDIANELYLSVKTIEAHREHIKQKLGLQSSGELLRYAIRLATVTSGEV
jgi:DNA-binding NarL/FixJ family response regulator